MEKPNKYELETLFEIWDNSNSNVNVYQVGPDRDGLGLIEIRYCSNGQVIDRLSFPVECAELIAKSLYQCVSNLKEKQEKI